MSQTPRPWSPPDPLPESSTISAGSALRREVGVVMRSRRLIGGLMGVSVLVATLYNYGTRPLFESVSVLSLDQAGDSVLNAGASIDAGRMQDALQEQVRRLKSPELALLAVDPVSDQVRHELALGPLGDWMDRVLEEGRYRIGLAKSYGSSAPEMVGAFRSRLIVDYTPPEKWVYVRFRGYDPNAAALALNRLIDVYLEETAKETAGATGASREQLAEKVTERQGQVVETLGKLEQFEKKEGLQNVNTRRDLLTKELARLQDALISARQSRQSRLALFEESQRASGADLLSIPSIREDREVSETTSRISDLESKVARAAATYGDLHPELVALRSELDQVRKRLAARLSTLRDSIARDYRLAQREEADIGAGIASTQRTLSQLEKNSVEHSFIQKQAEAGQRAVGELIEKSVRDSDEQIYFAPKVLQRGEPSNVPVSPQRGRNFQIAIAVGGLLGLLLAWLTAHLDETLKTPEDVKLHLGMPLLGMVPRVNPAGFDLFAPEDPTSTRLFEAYRVLRTNLTLGVVSRDHPFILMTSSREAEGKTTTSCGLAVALALAGRRVLLIDGDLRRGTLSRTLRAHAHWGVTDALGGRSLDECLMPTPVAGLDLLPTGTPPPNPAEVLDHFGFASLIETIRPRYDWILCDAPPVLAVADAAILCRLADFALVVVGANSTPLGAVRATLDQLAAVGGRIAGLVLNGVDLSRDSHYYKYYYSGHYADYAGALRRFDGKAEPPAGTPSSGAGGIS